MKCKVDLKSQYFFAIVVLTQYFCIEFTGLMKKILLEKSDIQHMVSRNFFSDDLNMLR